MRLGVRGARVAGIVVLSALAAWVSIAAAATPLDNVTYQGSTTHDRYTLGLEPICYKKNYETRNCKKPANLEVNLEPTAGHGSKCPDAGVGVSFSDVTLTPFKISSNGSFSGTGYFTTGKPQETFTVTGRFVKKRTVEGTVSGNLGCGTDTYKITAPAQ